MYIGFNHIIGHNCPFTAGIPVRIIEINSIIKLILSEFRNLIARYNRRFATININTVASMSPCDGIAGNLNTVYIRDVDTLILAVASVVRNQQFPVIGGTVIKVKSG